MTIMPQQFKSGRLKSNLYLGDVQVGVQVDATVIRKTLELLKFSFYLSEDSIENVEMGV